MTPPTPTFPADAGLVGSGFDVASRNRGTRAAPRGREEHTVRRAAGRTPNSATARRTRSRDLRAVGHVKRISLDGEHEEAFRPLDVLVRQSLSA